MRGRRAARRTSTRTMHHAHCTLLERALTVIRFAFRPRYCRINAVSGPRPELIPQCDSDILRQRDREHRRQIGPARRAQPHTDVADSPLAPTPHAYPASTVRTTRHLCSPRRCLVRRSILLSPPHSAPPAKAQPTDAHTHCLTPRSPLADRRPRITSPRDAPHAPVWPPLPLTPVASNPKVSYSCLVSADSSPSPPPRYPIMSVIRAAGAP